MYADFRVEIPSEKGKITRKTIKGTTYVYYTMERVYDPVKKYSEPKATVIGKVCKDDPGMMIPNERYYNYFPDTEGPEEDVASLNEEIERQKAVVASLKEQYDAAAEVLNAMIRQKEQLDKNNLLKEIGKSGKRPEDGSSGQGKKG